MYDDTWPPGDRRDLAPITPHGNTGAEANWLILRDAAVMIAAGVLVANRPCGIRRLITVDMVSGNYFSLVGVTPQRGRAILPADDRPGGDAVVVISDAYWDSRFGRAADVLGRTISISGTSFAIVGVAPRGFSGEVVGDPTRFWVPIARQSEVVPELPGQLTSDWQTGWAWVRILARLEPGVSRPGPAPRRPMRGTPSCAGQGTVACSCVLRVAARRATSGHWASRS